MQTQASKLDLYSQVIAQIAQVNPSLTSLLGPIAEDLKVLSDTESISTPF